MHGSVLSVIKMGDGSARVSFENGTSGERRITLVLLIQMTRQIVTCIVLMHKGPINAGNRFNHILKTLGHVVAISKTHVLVEHNIHFNV